jgi:Ras-related protein Rab-1A
MTITNIMNPEYDFLIKVVVVGDSGVGKSCLLLRYCDDTYTDSYISTIGVDFKIKTFDIGNKTIKLQVWDTAGQERFRTIVTSYYRGSNAVMIVYDITDIASFDHIPQWLNEINQMCSSALPKILVGNKSDMTNRRAVSFENAKAFAEAHSMEYIETSAKNNSAVNDAFHRLSEITVEKLGSGKFTGEHPASDKIPVTLGNPILPPWTPTSKCC